MSTAFMARKAASKGKPSDDRSTVISMKGTAEFRDWLHRLAEHQRVSAVQVIELALVEFARNRGFKEAAPKRTQ